MENNWQSKALCKNYENSKIWFSYDMNDVKEAKKICAECTVRIPCFMSAWKADECYGVRGGLSEFEYLNETWKAVTSARQSNRTRSDSVLKRILQRIK